MKKILLSLFLVLSFWASYAQSGLFVTDRKISATYIGGFTSTDLYYTPNGTGPQYNLTGFSFWTVILPTLNTTSTNIQFIGGRSSWNQSGAGWGFRTYQGSINQYIDVETYGESAAEKFSQGMPIGYCDVGKITVLHTVIRSNVIYTYKNGVIMGNQGTNGPGINKTTNTGTTPTFGIGLGGYAGAQTQIKPFEGSILTFGICSSTGLTDQQVKNHYKAILSDPYASVTGATNLWKAPDAGATWTDAIGGLVATKFGNPTKTTSILTYSAPYDDMEAFGDTEPIYSQIPNTLGSLDVLTFGDSRTAATCGIRYWSWLQKNGVGLSNLRFVGRFPTPTNYVTGNCGYEDKNNGMSGQSTRACIDGFGGIPPAASELNTFNPAAVIIWFGHNSAATVTSMQSDMEELINVIFTTKPNIRVLICSEVSGLREDVNASGSPNGLTYSGKYGCYNYWLRERVSYWRKIGRKISYVNLMPALKYDIGSDYIDLLHPVFPGNGQGMQPGLTEVGTNKVAKIVWPALMNLLGYRSATDVYRDITFTNPITGKTWKTDSTSTGTIKAPPGYSVSYKIYAHPKYNDDQTPKTLYTKFTGVGTTVTHTFDSTWGVYDLEVTATRSGYPNIVRIFPAEFTIIPPWCPMSKADVVYNMASGGIGSKDGGWVDVSAIVAYNPSTTYAVGNKAKFNNVYWRSKVAGNLGNTPSASPNQWERWYGSYVYVYGNYTGTGAHNPYYWRSDDPQYPVVFQYANVTIHSTVKMFSPGQCQNTIFTGSSQQGKLYGLKLEKDATATVDLENLVFDCFDGVHRSKGIMICGVDIDNLNSSVGGTGVQVTTRNTVADNYSTVRMRDMWIYNIRVMNTRNEGGYILHFSDSPTSGRSYSPGINFMFYRWVTNLTGNEGFQISSCINCEIFNCTFINAGTRDQSQHRNQVQFGGGNKNLYYYMNKSYGNKNAFNGSTGKYGTGWEVFSNLWSSDGKTAVDGVNFQVVLEQNDSVPSIDILWKNNTISLRGTGYTQYPFSIYNQATTTTFDKHRFDGNAIYSYNTTSLAEYPNSYSPGAAQVANNQQYSNSSTFQWINTTEFKPGSQASPLFRSRTPMTIKHRYGNFDVDGYQFVPGHPVDGCYSGQELFTGN